MWDYLFATRFFMRAVNRLLEPRASCFHFPPSFTVIRWTCSPWGCPWPQEGTATFEPGSSRASHRRESSGDGPNIISARSVQRPIEFSLGHSIENERTSALLYCLFAQLAGRAADFLADVLTRFALVSGKRKRGKKCRPRPRWKFLAIARKPMNF